jgi:hypothetical protein
MQMVPAASLLLLLLLLLLPPANHTAVAAAAAAALAGSPPRSLIQADGDRHEQTINDVLAGNPVGKCAADVPRGGGKDQACGRDQV